MPRKPKEGRDKAIYKPTTVAQHVAQPLVDGEVVGSNLGLKSRHS